MIAAVLLAAGEGSRMKELKQTLPWKEGFNLAQASLEIILACKEIEGPIRVVIGAKADQVQKNFEKYSDSRLEIRRNQEYKKGMISSIKTGLESLPGEVEGFFIALADQPLISPGTYTELTRVFREGEHKIIVPVYRGNRGHPVFMSSDFLAEILEMPDSPGGLRPLLKRYQDQVLWKDVKDPGVTIDLDYPEDYFHYRREGK